MRPLADLDVLVVDCQTTGASPTFGEVLELGWGIAQAAPPSLRDAESRWIVLSEGTIVSRLVQRITGYDSAAAAEAVPAAETWQRLRAATGNSPLAPAAIHYARFELPFLRDWSSRFEPDVPFPLDVVCLHEIARRLHPGLPRQSLRALAGFLGHGLELTRRSSGHVEASAFVWQRLCEDLAERGIVTWEELRAWLDVRAAPVPRQTKPKYPIDPKVYRTLPDAPGVYRFLRRNGDVLYVGKAASLKKRAASHFLGRAGAASSPEMLTQVADIEITLVATAWEAALLENETIKSLAPPYNTQLVTTDPRVWFGDRELVSAEPTEDELHTIGPLVSETTLRPLGALIAIVAGAPITTELRARAVGVSALWMPDEDVFRAGFELAASRSPLLLAIGPERARARALLWARELLLGGALRATDETEAEERPEGWDPPRVARHLGRAAAQAFQAYRRARWMRRLANASVALREPDASSTRVAFVRGGVVTQICDASDAAPVFSAPLSAVFDRTVVDRLRILTSEMKRVARDGGEVSITWRGRRERTLVGARLRAVLQLV